MKVAIYLRVSTEEQRERQSIRTQRDFAERFCQLHDHTVADFYADDGVSGTVALEKRPEGARLLKDARAKQFDAVLVYKLDRLGRDPRLTLNAVKELEDLGVKVRSMTEDFDTSSPAGRFLITILSGVAGLERDNIIQRSAEGIGRLVREGAWVGGVAPYGYRVEGRHREARLVVSEVSIPGSRLTEAGVIRLAFRMAGDEGKSCLAIADALNKLGVPAAYGRSHSEESRGKRRRATAGIWRDTRLQYILRSPTYKGVHFYGKKPNNRARQVMVVQRQVPAIVDEALWQRAQETLTRNRLYSRRNSRRIYLLRGLIRCAHCGRTYVGSVYTSASRPERPYYVCGGRHKGRKIAPDPASRCSGMAIPGDIDEVVWADVERFLRNPSQVIEELKRLINAAAEKTTTVETRLEGLRSTLEGKDAERERLITLYRRGRIDDGALDRQLDEIERERVALRSEIGELEVEDGRARDQEKGLVTAAQLLAELSIRVGAPPTPELRRQIVEKLVDGITVETVGQGAARDSHVQVTYRFRAPDPSIAPHTNRGIRVLQTLALPLGNAASMKCGAETYSASARGDPSR